MNQHRFNENFGVLLFYSGLITVIWFIWHKAGWDWGVLAIGLLFVWLGLLPERRGPRPPQ